MARIRSIKNKGRAKTQKSGKKKVPMLMGVGLFLVTLIVVSFLQINDPSLIILPIYEFTKEDTDQPADVIVPINPPPTSTNNTTTATVTHNNNPWYGWQPSIASITECSWRECFKKERQINNKCATSCRDSIEDWGEAPPPPADDWVPDVTMLKRMYIDGHDANGNPWPPSLDKELCENIGPNGEGDDDKDLELIQTVPISAEPFTFQGPRILCLMYTMENSHSTTVRASRETWAPGCDGFLAFSTKSDPRIPAVSVPHAGKEEYNNMWQKVRSIWKYVGQHYLNDYDFFHLGGDDMYVLPQNLRILLSQYNPNEDHFLGRRLLKPIGAKDNYYNVGGPGYTLSRETLKKFYEIGLEHPKCMPKARRSSEDVWIAKCLRLVFNIFPEDARDSHGRERFHHYSPASTYEMTPAMDEYQWYFDASRPWGVPKVGKDCCASDSVAFHYIKQPAMMRHIHKLLYDCK